MNEKQEFIDKAVNEMIEVVSHHVNEWVDSSHDIMMADVNKLKSELYERLLGVISNRMDAQLDRIEQHLEGAFLTANYQHTEEMGGALAAKLKKFPKDIQAMAILARLDNDQRIIEPRLRAVSCAIWRSIMARGGNGQTLKYFELEPPVARPNETKMIIIDGGSK